MPGTQFLLVPSTSTEAAFAALEPALTAAGWRVVPHATEPGWWTIERGDTTSTVLLGGLSSNYLLRFPLAILPDGSGGVSAAVYSEQGVDAVKGGLIGRSKSRDAETGLLAEVQNALVAAGLFSEWRQF